MKHPNHSFNVVRTQENKCLHSSPPCLCSLSCEGATLVVHSAPSRQLQLHPAGSGAGGTGSKRLRFLPSWRWKEANTPRTELLAVLSRLSAKPGVWCARGAERGAAVLLVPLWGVGLFEQGVLAGGKQMQVEQLRLYFSK